MDKIIRFNTYNVKIYEIIYINTIILIIIFG